MLGDWIKGLLRVSIFKTNKAFKFNKKFVYGKLGFSVQDRVKERKTCLTLVLINEAGPPAEQSNSSTSCTKPAVSSGRQRGASQSHAATICAKKKKLYSFVVP